VVAGDQLLVVARIDDVSRVDRIVPLVIEILSQLVIGEPAFGHSPEEHSCCDQAVEGDVGVLDRVAFVDQGERDAGISIVLLPGELNKTPAEIRIIFLPLQIVLACSGPVLLFPARSGKMTLDIP
jgi:hypothetical protein